MTKMDEKDLEQVIGGADTFDKRVGGGLGPKPTKDPILVEGEDEDPIGGSPGVTPVEDPEGLGGGSNSGTFGL